MKETRARRFTGLRRVLAVAAIGVLGVAGLTACTAVATPAAMCGYVVGNGQDGEDANIHRIVYPNETAGTLGEYEEIHYVPCGDRNYIITDGEIKNANGQVVGDRQTPTIAYTRNGVEVKISSSAYWTLNQSLLKRFYELCHKYTCYSMDTDGTGNVNSSTKGWNSMLGENFGPSIDRALLVAVGQIDDNVWQKHDPDLYKALGDAASAEFMNQVRKTTGYSDDLFCGSGNSKFSDDNNHSGWACSQVRIVIDKVDATRAEAQNVSQQAALDQARIEQAQRLYGDRWQEVLAAQDLCAKAQSCVISVGADGVPVVVSKK